MKTFVLDTNILLHDPNSIFSFGANEIVIPAIVLEELDSKKREQSEIGRNARTISRIILGLRKSYKSKLNKGIPLENGGILRIELNHISFDKMEEIFLEKTNDNRILAVAMNLKTEFEQELDVEAKAKIKELYKQFENDEIHSDEMWESYYQITGRLFTLISNDNNVVVKADTLGINVEQYENDRVANLDIVHKGYHEVHVPSELINSFYEKKELKGEQLEAYIRASMGLKEDEALEDYIFTQDFVILKSQDGSKQSGLGRFLRTGNSSKLVSLVIDEEDNEYKVKGVANPGLWGVNPRNVQQRMFIELLLDPNVSLVLGIGPAGTGKTLLALAAALQLVEDEKSYRKVLAARPVIPMGKDLGFLPGDKDDKLRPWMQPIYDNLEFLLGIDKEESEYKDEEGNKRKTVDDEIKKLKIEIEALTYIRGRSIPFQFMFLDEAQNMSGFEGKTLISRAGEGTKIVLCGDPEQIDHPYLDSTNNALTYIAERMKKEPDVGIVRFVKTERSKLAEKAAKLL